MRPTSIVWRFASRRSFFGKSAMDASASGINRETPAALGRAAHGAARPLTIGLVQINNSFSGQNYLPYSVALLQSYVEHKAADPSRYRFLLPLYRRLRIGDAVEQLVGADLVGFSTYVWNGRISLEI